MRGADSFKFDLFKNKHVLVSGASGGIGLAIAEGFAALGAKVTATGTNDEKLASARDQNQAITFERLDVRSRDDVGDFFSRFGELDVLINCAGIGRPNDEYDEDVYLEVMDVNLNSAMRMTSAAITRLRQRRGNVINIASMLSYLADGELPAYGASKTGILGLTRALAHRFGPDGVRVNAVAPGYHQTTMTERLWTNPESSERISRRSALKRWGTTDDLAGAVLFLASPAAGFITGEILAVDGGFVSGIL